MITRAIFIIQRETHLPRDFILDPWRIVMDQSKFDSTSVHPCSLGSIPDYLGKKDRFFPYSLLTKFFFCPSLLNMTPFQQLFAVTT